MLYREARERIESGDLLFFRGTACYSRVIQRWTRSVYSHVAIALWSEFAGVRRLFVAEAMEGRGIQLVPVSAKLRAGESIDWFRLVDHSVDRCEVTGWALDKVGLCYASPRQLFRSFVTVPLLNSLRIPTKLDQDRWFCSWFAAEALLMGGWIPPADESLRPELASPGDVSLFPCLHRRGRLVLERKP